MKKLISVSLFFFLLFTVKSFSQTAGEKKGWSKEDRLEFITSCIGTAKSGMSEDSARHYCLCMLDRVQAKYSTAEEAGKLTAEELASPAWKKIIQDCLTGQWNSTERSEFITSCIDAAKAGIGEERAKAYCECMLYKVEKRYPKAADAARLTGEELAKPEWKKALQDCLQ